MNKVEVNKVDLEAQMNALADKYFDTKDGAERRALMVRYLIAVIWVLRTWGFRYTTTLPIRDLTEALSGLDNREESPLLSKPKTPGKPLTLEKTYRYAAAAAMTLLIKKGKSKTDAAKKVVDVWRKNGQPLPGKKIGRSDQKSLIAWRDKCMSGKYGRYAEWAYHSFFGAARPPRSCSKPRA